MVFWVVVLALVALISFLVYADFMSRRSYQRKRVPRTMEQIQSRMSHLSREIRHWEQSDSPARGHHLRAAQIAYDGLLAEACVLAGIESLANQNPNYEPTLAQRMVAEANSLDVVPAMALRPSASRMYTYHERSERELNLASLGLLVTD